MADQAFPSIPRPPTDVIAFYIGGQTPHVWTWAEIVASPERYRLPIYTRVSNFDPIYDAAFIVHWLQSHNAPLGITVALDLEASINPQYVATVDTGLMHFGYKLMIYGQNSTIAQNGNPSGGIWGAEWHPNGLPFMISGDMATQYVNDGILGKPWDLSLVSDNVILWDTQGDDMLPDERQALLEIRKMMGDPVDNTNPDNISGGGIPWAINELLKNSRVIPQLLENSVVEITAKIAALPGGSVATPADIAFAVIAALKEKLA